MLTGFYSKRALVFVEEHNYEDCPSMNKKLK